MKHTTLLTLLLCTFCLPAAHAVIILECVDEAGNSTYQDHCPPGTTPAHARDIKTGQQDTATAEPAAPKQPTAPSGAAITLYTTSLECDACLVIKSVLSKYGASFTEKDISSDMTARKELMDKTGGSGSASVPTVIIGDQVIAGFNKEAVAKALEDEGYAKPEAPAAPEQKAPPTPPPPGAYQK